MNQTEILLRIILTIAFGAILGLESETREIEKVGKKEAEKREREKIGGLRTYSVLALFGGIAGIFFNENIAIISYIMLIGVILLIVAAYVLNVKLKHAFGLTTEIAIIVTFLLGFLTTSAIIDIEIVLMILVLLSFFLSNKRGFGSFISRFEHKEIIDLIKFGLVAIIVLPILPNENFVISDIVSALGASPESLNISTKVLNFTLINPFKMWLIVVIISGISLIGHLLSKFLGAKKGITVSAILGGIISSTSTTIALASKSKEENKSQANILAGSALMANAVSFLHTSTILLISSTVFFKEIFPALFSMFIIGTCVGLFFILSTKEKQKKGGYQIKYEPYSIVPAIKFVSLIIAIKLIVQTLEIVELGNLSLIVTAVSGFTGLDAAAIALSDLVQSKNIAMGLALATLLGTNLVNFFAKGMYGRIGGSETFEKKLIIGLLITSLGSLVVLFV